MEVTKTFSNSDEKYTVNVDFGEEFKDPKERLEFLVDQWGLGACINLLTAKAKIDYQSFIGREVKKDDFDPEELQELVDAHKPGLRAAPKAKKVDRAEVFKQELAAKKSELTDEEFRVWLAEQLDSIGG
jgi:hypothetical protein